MQIFIAQQNYTIGDFIGNTTKIIKAIEEAISAKADLIVFSELAICGAPPKDYLHFPDFIEKCANTIDILKKHSQNIGVIIGAPVFSQSKGEKKLYNAAYFLYENTVKQIIYKTALSSESNFNELAYFQLPTAPSELIFFKEKKIALTIGDDIDLALENNNPIAQLLEQQPDLLINIASTPFYYSKKNSKAKLLQECALRYKTPVIYCNTVGSQTEMLFSGASFYMNAQGDIVQKLPLFKEQLANIYVDFCKMPSACLSTLEIHDEQLLNSCLHIDAIYEALVLGVRDFFEKMNFKKAILGSSGGIDSAVTIAIACEAIGADNVLAILMPSPYSTEHSVKDAIQLSENLKNPYEIIHIKEIYESFLAALAPQFKDLPFSIAEENIQSRSRGNLLMAIANKLGYILLNTSNKSELATGYGTLYGDMAGGISVLGDCYKTQVYALAKYINREKEIIPNHIITKPPSAELRPNQKDSDSLPDYDILDQIIYLYMERYQTANAIKALGFEPNLVDKTLHLINIAEYKRHQFCPIISISSKTFGHHRKIPVLGKYTP